MLNTNDINIVAKEKIAQYKKGLVLQDKIIESLAQFNGKSLTGNKKRITDTLQALDKNLVVDIKCSNILGHTYLNFEITLRTVYHETLSNGSVFNSGYIYLVSVSGYTENIVDMEKVKESIENIKQYLTRDIKQAKDTAKNIERLAEQVKELKNRLATLSLESDKDLTDAFGIDFRY